MGFLTRYQAVLLSVLRITSSYMFLLHGSQKLFAVPYVEKYADLPLFSLLGFAGVLEFFGGLLLLLGLFTRPVAFLLSGMMAVAYFMAHASKGAVLLPILNGGEAAVLYCFLFLYLAAAGGGAWALDNKLKTSH